MPELRIRCGAQKFRAVRTDLDQEVDEPQHQEARRSDRAPQRAALGVRARLLDLRGEVAALRRAEPVGVLHAILEPAQHQPAERQAGQAADQEQPMPAGLPQHAVHLAEDQARDRRADQAGHRRREEQHRRRAAAVAFREPQRQVVQHPRREARLHRADDEAQRVELPLGGDEHHGRRREPPRDHDACDPAPCADAVQQQVAGHLEDHVADHEQAGAESVGRVAQGQRALQLELREADVDAVEEREQVADHDQRHESPGDFADQRVMLEQPDVGFGGGAAIAAVGGNRRHECLLPASSVRGRSGGCDRERSAFSAAS